MFVTKIDELFTIIEKEKKVKILSVSKELNVSVSNITKIARYLEQLGFVTIDYKAIEGPKIIYVKSPEIDIENLDEAELINKLKFFKSLKDVRSANKLIYDLYCSVKLLP